MLCDVCCGVVIVLFDLLDVMLENIWLIVVWYVCDCYGDEWNVVLVMFGIVN